MGVTKPEPTVEELLSDPMMVPVLHYARTTADDVRSLMRDARERLEKLRSGGNRGAGPT
jgi:hypothetical protein